jgi:acyl-CoA thioesterase
MADDTLDQIREKFSHDRFATDACGCRVDEARAGHAVCSLKWTLDSAQPLGDELGSVFHGGEPV